MRIRCFLSAFDSTYAKNIISILQEYDVNVYLPTSLTYTGNTITEQIEKAISRSDFLIGVYDGNNDSVFFELGYAKALKKEFLLIISPSVKKLPNTLSGVLHIRAKPNDEDAIRYNLEQLISFIRHKKSIPSSIKPKKIVRTINENLTIVDEIDFNSKTIKKTTTSTLLKKYRKSIDDTLNELEFEHVLLDLFRSLGNNAIAESIQQNRVVDIAVWLDDLEAYANPLLIELKTKLDAHSIKKIIHQFDPILKDNLRWGLVIYREGKPSIEYNSSYHIHPNIFFIRVDELLDGLETKSLGKLVRQIRNKKVHGDFFG